MKPETRRIAVSEVLPGERSLELLADLFLPEGAGAPLASFFCFPGGGLDRRATGDAAVIDPAWDGHIILEAAKKRGWRIAHLWYTHAHFDHIGGAGAIADALNALPLVALHPNDHVLWRAGGGGAMFGFDIDPGPEPTIDFEHGQVLKLGSVEFEVRFTPGHTTGHCILYVPSAGVCFCGDLIFAGSVGRTDFPGGSWEQLENSIQAQVI